MNRALSLFLVLALLHAAAPAWAKDGDSGGNSGSGSSNSGSGGGDDDDDDGGDDDSDDDDDDDADDDEADDEGDSDRARSGVSSGAILPLETILTRLHPSFAGRLLDASLKHRRGRDIYELQIITPKGRVLEVDVDAATARVLNYEVE